MSEHNAQIASLDGMPKKEKKKVLKRMVREVMKDKRYRKAIKKSPAPVSKKAANAAATAAVDAVLGVKTGKPAVPPKKTGLEIYTEIIGKFAKARRNYKKKRFKALKKEGFNPKTGLIVLKKAKGVKKAKLNKPYKAKKPRK